MSGVSWMLGGLELAGSREDRQSGGYWFETLADGWDLGEPEAVKVVFASLAADGDDERVTRHGNRTVAFQVAVCGPDTLATAAGERALRLAMGRRTELVFTPPDGFGESAVFDVLNATMKYDADDFALTRSEVRVVYAVTLTCEPFTRPVDPVTVSLTYGASAPTTLDDGSSVSGWSSPDGPLSAVTISSETAVKLAPTSPPQAPAPPGSMRSYRVTRAGLALPSAQPYLAVDLGITGSGAPGLSPGYLGWPVPMYLMIAGQKIAPVASLQLPNGFKRFWFPHSLAGTTQTVDLVPIVGGSFYGLDGVYVGGVYAYATPPDGGTMLVDIAGSERSPLSLRVRSGGGLGTLLMFSDPALLEFGYNPVDPATWGNAPSGSYTVLCTRATSWSTSLHTLKLGTLESKSVAMSDTPGSALMFDFDLGARRDGRIGAVGTVLIDGATLTASGTKAYLLRNEPGVTAVTYLNAVPHSYVFIDAPTAGGAGGVWGGALADGSDAVSLAPAADVLEWPLGTPPAMPLFLAANTSISATVTHYPAHHTFVAARSAS